jgi:hypothetical protein
MLNIVICFFNQLKNNDCLKKLKTSGLKKYDCRLKYYKIVN